MYFPGQREHNVNVVYNGAELDVVYDFPILGIHLDDRLLFNNHINGIVSRVKFTLTQLYTCSLSLPRFVKGRLVNDIVMPNILSGLEVFSAPKQRNMKQIALAFIRTMRYVYSLKRREHISSYANRFLSYLFSLVSQQLLLNFNKTSKTSTRRTQTINPMTLFHME